MTPLSPIDHFTRYKSTPRFASLDGLRFLCIAAVLWHHSPMLHEWGAVLFSRGHLGVHMFFVLSGFLITTLLLREEEQHGRFSLPAFFWRRALRILPVYLLVVTVAAAYDIVLRGNTDNLALLPYYYLFLSNFIAGTDIGFLAPTWSLALEEQYYLIWPLILLLVPRRWIVPVLLGLIALNVAGAMGAFGTLPFGPLALGLYIPTYAPILMGSLVAILLHGRAGFHALYRLAGFAHAPLVWLGLLVLASAVLPRELSGAQNLLLHVLMCLWLAALVVREDHVMAPALTLPPIARIGQISYGIYLYHLFALAVAYQVTDLFGLSQTAWILPLMAALSIVMAEISFRTYEAWFMGLRDAKPGRTKPRELPKLEPHTARA